MIKINDKEIKVKKFPNGEILLDGDQIIGRLQERNVLTFKFETNEDLINLMFIKKHIDSHGFNSDLEIMYMPYSRMDRSENGGVFTLKYVGEFINSLGFGQITVLEPHSDVTMAVLDKSFVSATTYDLFRDLNYAFSDFRFDIENDYVYFPDAGASKKYGKMFKKYKTLIGNKDRDFDTGRILSLDIFGESDLKGNRVVIIDDLCSRGGTFLLSAQKLKEIGAGEIILVVTHCEKTILDGNVLHDDSISKVYCTDSIIQEEDIKNMKTHITNKLKIIKL